MSSLNRFFELEARGSCVSQEFRGAVATFLTMAYILAANPLILSSAGIPTGPAIACTALAAGIACIIMGLYANFPLALASGMGLNALIASLVSTGKMNWQTAMGLVVLDGAVVLLLVLVGVREAIMKAIPKDLRLAIGAGIGVFIAFIGLVNAKLVVVPASTVAVLGKFPGAAMPPVEWGNVRDPAVLVFLGGMFLTAFLFARKITGSLIIGMIATTVLAIILGVAHVPAKFAPLSWEMFSIVGQADIKSALNFAYIPLLMAVIMVDFFDTLGTATAIAEEADLMRDDGSVPKLRQLLIADSVAASIGGFCGISSVTCYVESASGVAEGARTGLSSVFVGLMFFASILVAPFVAAVPAAATAPALVLVGFLMMCHMKQVDLDDWEAAIPAFLTFVTIPLTYSIAHGIALGFIAFVVIKVLSGKAREVHPMMYVSTLLLAGYLALPNT